MDLRSTPQAMPDEAGFKRILDNMADGVYFVDAQRRITYWNRGAERITGYGASEVVGRRCMDNLLVHVDEQGNQLCLLGCPLHATMLDGQARQARLYLRHRDGHRIPVAVRVAPLSDADGNTNGAVEVFTDDSQRLIFLERMADLERAALLDPLTSIPNRRLVEDRLRSCFAERQRYGWQFGILFLDVDHFKRINDTWGHDAGDEVLKLVARILVSNSRSFDTVGRWGGEEFVVVCPNVDGGKLEAIADRMRALIENSSLTFGADQIDVTVSVGAALPAPGETPEQLIRVADRLMYEGKKAGRNRVSLREEG